MFKRVNMLIASIFTTLLAFPLTAKAEEHPLIGVQYPPLPEEVDEMGGWLMDSSYVVDRAFMGGQDLLLLGRLTERDKQGKGLHKVVDVLTLPQITETEEITGGLLCFVNGKQDHGIVAIMKSDYNAPYLTKVRQAWRIENEKFNAISIQGLQFQCDNPSYGL